MKRMKRILVPSRLSLTTIPPLSHLFGIFVRAETSVENPRSRVSSAPLRLKEALGLGEYQDTSPVQIGLQPSGTGNRAYLKER